MIESNHKSWSAVHWTVAVVLALGMQATVVRFLGRGPRPPQVDVCSGSCVALYLPASTDLRPEWVPDPAQFALPDRDGFSGSVLRWRPRVPEPGAIPGLPQVVLSGASDNAALGLVPEPAAILPARSGRKTGPLQSYQSPPLVAETTQVIFDPRIKDRSPTNLPALPVWRGQQLPLRTRIELSIDPWGYVAGLHVAESSGSKEMDNLGSEVVRQWRFRPAFGADFDHPYNPASLARGIVTLNWAPAPVETR